MASITTIVPHAPQADDGGGCEHCPLGCPHDADLAETARCIAEDLDAAAISRLAAATLSGAARHGRRGVPVEGEVPRR